MLACPLVMLSCWSPGAGVWSAGEARADVPEQSETQDGEEDYVGVTKCAACHYPQYKDWKPSPHGKAQEVLPAKYQKDVKCLECHATGAGHPSVDEAALAAGLQGVSCEACHGPGGKHARYALTFVGQGRELTPESLEVLRSRIQRNSLEQCIRCHVSVAHKPHPEFEREQPARPAEQTGGRASRRTSFFQPVHGSSTR
jgi:hypothetical protein